MSILPTMPFDMTTIGPTEFDRGNYLTFSVPDTQAMNVEWVEVKVDISGNAADLDHLRIMLVSPDGTQSELSNFYERSGLRCRSRSQINTGRLDVIDAAGDLANGDHDLDV